MSKISRLVFSSLALAALAGCHELTQVVVVLQSDLAVPAETDGLLIGVSEGPSAPMPAAVSFASFASFTGFPRSFGVTSGGMTSNFSITAQLISGARTHQPLIVVNRSVTDIHFVDERTMMLVLPLPRACACAGTSCPSPGDPQCDSIDKPVLQPFDSTVAPPSGMMNVPPLPPTSPGP